MDPDTQALVAAILNESWMVRHYVRSGLYRQQAILKLGLTVRQAFSSSNEYEALLTALVDGLSPSSTPPRF